MTRRVLATVALAALLVAALPAVALAKGPDAARISGPGMGGPVDLSMSGEEGGGTTLSTIVEETGLFPAMWAATPNPMLPARPDGNLGPMYTIVYHVPNGPTTADQIRQELYPYAPGGPVTFTPPGQRIFDSKAPGGWYRGSAGRLLPVLADLGVPRPTELGTARPAATRPAADAPSAPAPGTAERPAGLPTSVVLGLAVVAGCLALMAVAVVRGHRRRHPAVGG
jgi:hypothetical protein